MFLGTYTPGISRKMGWRQVEQGFSSIFAKFLPLFDDFSKFYSIFGVLHFEKSSNRAKEIDKKWRKALFDLPSIHFFGWFQVPENRNSGTWSAPPLVIARPFRIPMTGLHFLSYQTNSTLISRKKTFTYLNNL